MTFHNFDLGPEKKRNQEQPQIVFHDFDLVSKKKKDICHSVEQGSTRKTLIVGVKKESISFTSTNEFLSFSLLGKEQSEKKIPGFLKNIL